MAVRLGDHIWRRALEQVQCRHLRRDLWHELDRGRAAADDGNPLAVYVVIVVPPCGVEDLSGERVQTREVWLSRAAELAGRCDEEPGGGFRAVSKADRPFAGAGVEGGDGHFGVEADVGEDTVLASTGLDVAADLRRLTVARDQSALGSKE